MIKSIVPLKIDISLVHHKQKKRCLHTTHVMSSARTTWESNLSQNEDINTIFLAKTSPVASKQGAGFMLALMSMPALHAIRTLVLVLSCLSLHISPLDYLS